MDTTDTPIDSDPACTADCGYPALCYMYPDERHEGCPRFLPSRSPLQCATPEAVSDEDAGCAEKHCELCGEYESECICDEDGR